MYANPVTTKTAVALSPLRVIIATAIGTKSPASPSPPESSASMRRSGIAPSFTVAISAADRAHRPRRGLKARLVDTLLELLAPDGVPDQIRQLVVARAGP